MSDQSAFDHFPRLRKPQSEFTIYFVIILAVAVPLETLGWAVAALWRRRLPELGPIARARRTAAEITPVIFQP